VAPEDVAALSERAHHYGASTVNRKLAAVASFYLFHSRHRAKAGEVLRGMQAPGRGCAGTAFCPRPLPRVRTAAKAQAILDACSYLRDRLLLGTLLDTGIRIGEALGMRHEDIDIGGCRAGQSTRTTCSSTGGLLPSAAR
jgi:integrase/recombinase XerD